jgi:hypothetical protein
MAVRSAATEGRRGAPAPDRLPTLTEVVELSQQSTAAIAFGQHTPEEGLTASTPEANRAAEMGAQGQSAPEGAAESAFSDAVPGEPGQADLSPGMREISALVMAELQPRIDMLLESRLREALAPALARAADGLIRDSRDQLAGALQSLVDEAVTRVLEQRRNR